MNTTNSWVLLATGLVLACASTARAQNMPLDGKGFLNVNGGGQTQSRTFINDFTFPIYGQTAAVTTTSAVDGGPIFDIDFGYKVRRRIGAALGFSSFSKTGSASGAASIPNPLFFNRPASVAISTQDAKRTERSIYLLVVGFVPVRDKIDLAVSIGPSFIRVKQELIPTFGPEAIQPGTQSLVSGAPALLKQSGTATGVNVGADLSYMVRPPMIGVGGFIRYNGGSVDLDSASDVKAGGFQLGAGVRLRF